MVAFYQPFGKKNRKTGINTPFFRDTKNRGNGWEKMKKMLNIQGKKSIIKNRNGGNTMV